MTLRKLRDRAVLELVIWAFAGIVAFPAAAAGQVSLRLSPPSLAADPGDVVTVEVLLSTANLEITLVQFSLDYDSTIVAYEGLTVGSDLDAAGFFVQQETQDPVWSPTTSGTNRNVVVQIYGGAGNSVAGDDLQVARLDLRVTRRICGSSPLALDPTCPRSEVVLLRPVVGLCVPDLELQGSIVQSTCVGAPPTAPTSEVRLLPNVPNPFNPVTLIPFELDSDGWVHISIYGVDGSHIRTLLDGALAAGRGQVTWDGRDARGMRISSGVYQVRLRTQRGGDARSVVLIK